MKLLCLFALEINSNYKLPSKHITYVRSMNSCYRKCNLCQFSKHFSKNTCSMFYPFQCKTLFASSCSHTSACLRGRRIFFFSERSQRKATIYNPLKVSALDQGSASFPRAIVETVRAGQYICSRYFHHGSKKLLGQQTQRREEWVYQLATKQLGYEIHNKIAMQNHHKKVQRYSPQNGKEIAMFMV